MRINPDTRLEQYLLYTEYCRLGSLHRFLESKPVENEDLCLLLCYDICAGLGYLHCDLPMLGGTYRSGGYEGGGWSKVKRSLFPSFCSTLKQAKVALLQVQILQGQGYEEVPVPICWP